MIGLLLGLIAYFMFSSGATFGLDLIYTLDVMESWYYFVLWVVGIIAIGFAGLFFIGGTAVGASAKAGPAGTILGMLAGGSLGMLVAARIVIVTVIQFALATWLMGSIDPTTINMDGLTTQQMIGLAMLVIIPLLTRNTGSSDDDDSSSESSSSGKTANISSPDLNKLFRTKRKNVNHPKSRVTFS